MREPFWSTTSLYWASSVGSQHDATSICCWARRGACSTAPAARPQLSIPSARMALNSKPTGRHGCCRSMEQTDGRTDTRPSHQPCSEYYAGAAPTMGGRFWPDTATGGSLDRVPGGASGERTDEATSRPMEKTGGWSGGAVGDDYSTAQDHSPQDVSLWLRPTADRTWWYGIYLRAFSHWQQPVSFYI